MLLFDKDLVKKIMMSEGGYSSEAADAEVIGLSKVDGSLQPVLDAYLGDRKVTDDFSFEGITVPMIMEKKGCNFWYALTGMQIFMEHPEMAQELSGRVRLVRIYE